MEVKGQRHLLASFSSSLLANIHLGGGGYAPSLGGPSIDGRDMLFPSTVTHDPTGIPKSLWARWKPLDATNKHKLMRMNI